MRRMLSPAAIQHHLLHAQHHHAAAQEAFAAVAGGGDAQAVRRMRAQEIVAELTQAGQGRDGGLNRDNHRLHANTALQQAEEKLRREYDARSIECLHEMCEKADLPIPVQYFAYPCHVDVRQVPLVHHN